MLGVMLKGNHRECLKHKQFPQLIMADENEEFFVKTSNCNYSSLDMFWGTSVA